MKSVLLSVLAAAVLFGLTVPVVAQTEKVAKPKDSKNNAGSQNSGNKSSRSGNSSNSGSSSNSGNRGSGSSSGSGSSNSGNSNSGNSGGSTTHHEFHSPTLDALKNSQTGQANGKGAPSSSHEYDGSKKRKE